ncbi:hypothetical protein EV702DRAFT_1202304 [Suillus placidus]|uniref:Uncharacterized protein n=1 Tax=Suillus placidus TaxID=48579 RepID=A0A9P6ZL24_9AGAM|nr:hypothetical protein EV702DRAFT_1202304 [Suillus placidus]
MSPGRAKNLGRDYPFQDHDPADPALFIQHTYCLHFLWLPHVRSALTVLSGWLERMEQRASRSCSISSSALFLDHAPLTACRSTQTIWGECDSPHPTSHLQQLFSACCISNSEV